MDAREINKLIFTSTLEDCLSACLDEKKFSCRSVSFNRTDGGCHLSQQNQLSKPSRMRMNYNPNYRIDYYENNCFNSRFNNIIADYQLIDNCNKITNWYRILFTIFNFIFTNFGHIISLMIFYTLYSLISCSTTSL